MKAPIRTFLIALSLFATVNSFSQVEKYIIKDIVIDGNKRTKESIITREITIHKGDTLTRSELDAEINQSENNLNNISLFVDIKSDIIDLGDNNIMLLFSLAERYYTYPTPLLKFEEPNFSTWLKNMNLDRTSYGISLIQKNTSGRDDTSIITAQLGFTKKISLAYYRPYINKAQKLGAFINMSFNQNDDVAYDTYDNKRVFFSEKNGSTKEEKHIGIGFTYRSKIHSYHEIYTAYRDISISDSLAQMSPDYLLQSASKREYLSMTYRLRINKTDNDAYPLKGSKISLMIQKNGLGIIDKTINLTTIKPTIKKYWKLSKNTWFHSGLSLKYSLYDKLPYRLQRGLGYGEVLARGFEFYVIDAQNFALLRNNLKFNLIKPKTFVIPFIKKDQFKYFNYGLYVNIFSDLAYGEDKVYHSFNSLSNRYIKSIGLGIDFVTSYDKVFRVEYSANDKKQGRVYFSYRLSI